MRSVFLFQNECQGGISIPNPNTNDVPNLSCPAIGLLGRILDLPPEWNNFTKAGLIAVCSDGETAIESALANLEKWEYIKTLSFKCYIIILFGDFSTFENLKLIKSRRF